MVDRITCLILGSLLGAGVTYILMKKHCDEVINEEVRQMKEYYASKNQKEEKKVAEPKESEKKEDYIVAHNLTKKPDREPVDYSAATRKEDRNIFLITSESFANEEPEYEKITLSFYEDDGVLCDSYGDIVDVEQSIGFKAVSYFKSLGQEVIYIRNTNLKIDYEIVLEHSAYSDDFDDGFRDSKY